MLTQLLSRLRKRKQGAGDPAPAARPKRRAGGAALLMPGLAVAAAVLLVLAVPAAMSYLAQVEQAGVRAEAAAQARADAVAGAVQGHLGMLVVAVERLARQPALVAAAEAGDAAAVAAAGIAVGALIPGYEGARVVYPSQQEPDYAAQPPLGYAALDLARRVEQGQQPAAEVHQVGNDHRQVAIARPVVAQGKTIGTLLVVVNAAGVAEWLGAAAQDGRVELMQGAVQLAAVGAAAAGEARTATASIPGGRWQVKAGVALTEVSPGEAVGVFAVAGLIQFALVVAAFLLVGRALRGDLVRFLRQFVQIYGGQRPAAVDMRLDEFRRAARALEQYLQVHHGAGSEASDLAPMASSFAVPRSGDDDLVPDLMFLERDALSVAELDEAQGPPPPGRETKSSL